MEKRPLLDEVRLLLGRVITSAGASEGEVKVLPDFQRDASVFAAFSLALFAFNWGVRVLLVAPFVQRRYGMKDGQVGKFGQSCMEAIFYGGFTVLGFLVVPSQDWVWPSELWWKGFTQGSHAYMGPDLRCYYILYMSRYFQAGLSVLLEPRRKDFGTMLLHHAVTVALCLASYTWGWNRVGAVCMLLFDPADVPLHVAKISKYVADASAHSRAKGRWQFVADRFFESFAVVFFITRLVMFSYVCWSASVEGPRVIPNAGGPAGWTCIGLLYVLLAMQTYWFFLIVQAAMKLYREGAVEDVRSDDDTPSSPVANAVKMTKHE